jgi:hypothetical protein
VEAVGKETDKAMNTPQQQAHNWQVGVVEQAPGSLVKAVTMDNKLTARGEEVLAWVESLRKSGAIKFRPEAENASMDAMIAKPATR